MGTNKHAPRVVVDMTADEAAIATADELAPLVLPPYDPADELALEPVITTRDRGDRAEAAAIEVLIAHGYAIVERNWRGKAGELDIVARHGRDGRTLVFVEVRSRADGDHGEAVEMVDARKQRQVIRVAEHYLHAVQPAYEEIRFDIVAITGDIVELVADAYRSGLRIW